MSAICLKPVRELLSLRFSIPGYQRGYRWTKTEAKDLLEDLKEFIDGGARGVYCLQPLVVKGRVDDQDNALQRVREILDRDDGTNENLIEACRNELKSEVWEIIDGQQRLTTIRILLSFIARKLVSRGETTGFYTIDYITRSRTDGRAGSKEFLEQIGVGDDDLICGERKSVLENRNIDFHHMSEVFREITGWFDVHTELSLEVFRDTLLEKVCFIWYEAEDPNPIDVFTRLNKGKISLTDAELIKALFLSRENFPEEERALQIQIAQEWDEIERQLQDDEFWLFIHKPGYDRPTRIDLIFDLMRETNVFSIPETAYSQDEHKTFRYFAAGFQTHFSDFPHKGESNTDTIRRAWLEVKEYYSVFSDWYNDLELYHYIGYLLALKDKGWEDVFYVHNDTTGADNRVSLKSLFKKWREYAGSTGNYAGKKGFKDFILRTVKNSLNKCRDVGKEYKNKTECRPLLLLHNVQTVIRQNLGYVNKKYGIGAFYKFPFHLFKKETWDVEHIDADTTNPMDKLEDCKTWLAYAREEVKDDELSAKIKAYLKHKDVDPSWQDEFLALQEEVWKKVGYDRGQSLQEGLVEDDHTVNQKNIVWNYCLLDASTNRGYQNAIFPSKRRCIIGKDQGKNFVLNKDTWKIQTLDGGIAFVPPCTRNVFTKYFSPGVTGLCQWTKADAEAYRKDILHTLEKDFGVKMGN